MLVGFVGLMLIAFMLIGVLVVCGKVGLDRRRE